MNKQQIEITKIIKGEIKKKAHISKWPIPASNSFVEQYNAFICGCMFRRFNFTKNAKSNQSFTFIKT